MKPNEKRSVPIEQEIWREMAQEKLNSGKDIYQLVAEGWRAYKSRHLKADNGEPPGTSTTPELKPNHSNPKDPRGLPQAPEGVILKNAQRALYSDLVAKLAEIIARGSPKLVGMLTQGIEWAHGELRPDRPKAEDSRAIAHPSPRKHGTGGNHPG